MKKIISLSLALILTLAFIPAITVGAADIIVVEIASGLEYDLIGNFSEGLANVVTGALMTPYEMSGGKNGYIDSTGTLVIPCDYDYAEPFSEGLARVGKNNRYGYIDKTGELIIPLTYSHAWSFSEGLAAVKKSGKYGYIDKTGEIIIPFEYDYAQPFSEGLGVVELNGKKGCIDKTGEVVIPLEYHNFWNFKEGRAVVSKSGSYDQGCINKAGKVIIPLEYTSIESFSEGLASVWKDGKFGYVDRSGKIIVPLKYNYTLPFSEGLGAVRVDETDVYDGKWGYIDKTGEIIIPIEYDNFGSFHEGLTSVMKGNKWGFIDKTGKIIVPFEYDRVSDLSEGLISAFDSKTGTYSILRLLNIDTKSTGSRVVVDGEEVAFDTYNINYNNYFKLRDLAYVLSGTEKQFEVVWDADENAITLISGTEYTVVGGEMAAASNASAMANKKIVTISSDLFLGDKQISFTAYTINGNNYFKLRDIAQSLDFSVEYDEENDVIIIDTSTGYSSESK